jgi:hypothetical protein
MKPNLKNAKVINSMSRVAMDAVELGMDLDTYLDFSKRSYLDIQDNYTQEVVLGRTQEPAKEIPKIEVGQVYSDESYNNDNGKFVVTKVRSDKVFELVWISGFYSKSSYRYDECGIGYFEQSFVRLIANRPEPAVGQIWEGENRQYILTGRHVDSGDGCYGWEYKDRFSGAWLRDEYFESHVPGGVAVIHFIGYEDDPRRE